MLEKDLEAKVVRFVKSRHGLIYKFSSPSHRGVSDRVIILPNGVVLFLELKRKGEKPTALQQKFIDEVNHQGGIAAWFDNLDDVKLWVELFFNLPKSGSRPYNIWSNMRDRCENPRSFSWKYYGERGITVCPRWSSFARFWADMADGYDDTLQLDRMNPERGYSKDNCRWATPKEQGRNKRNNVFIDTVLGRMLLVEACELVGIDYAVVQMRIRAGWPSERLLDPVSASHTPYLLR